MNTFCLEDSSFSNCNSRLYLDSNFTLREDSIWIPKNKFNEVDNFIKEFQEFAEMNDIDNIYKMNEDKWIQIDLFIFEYIFKLACENRIKDIIWDYGIVKGMILQFDIPCEKLQIIDYISKQYGYIYHTDMALYILRESIGFYSYQDYVKLNKFNELAYH
jgi:hypothetical protein